LGDKTGVPGDFPSHYGGITSEGIEPGQQIWVALPARGRARPFRGIDAFEGASLRLDVGPSVLVRRIEADMAEQAADHGDIDTGSDQLDAGGVAIMPNSALSA
jgi:hypothetical protein